MSGHGVRNGDTARLCEALGGGAKSVEELVAITRVAPGLVMRRLRQRAALCGDVEFIDDVWRTCKRTLPSRRETTQKAKRGVKTGAAAVQARAEQAVVCEVATSRTYSAPGTYVPPRLVIREGAFDYLATPTRVGDARLPYQGARNMSTVAIAAGSRSGLK